jgi:ArsR family transcriptional regulator
MEYTDTATIRRARAGRAKPAASQALDSRRLAANARQAADFLRTLANEHRLMILCALIERERSVGEIAARVGIAQPNASQHLLKLKAERLVATRRDGQTIYYRLVSRDVAPLIAKLYDMFCRA